MIEGGVAHMCPSGLQPALEHNTGLAGTWGDVRTTQENETFFHRVIIKQSKSLAVPSHTSKY